MPDCNYCDEHFESDGALLDHLLECEDRSEYLKYVTDANNESWFDAMFSKPVTPRVHGILDDVAIVIESLFPLPDAVFAAGLLAIEMRPTIVVSGNHRLTSCGLTVSTAGVQWSLKIGDFENSGTWIANAKDYTLAKLPEEAGEFATKAPYKQRVVQSLKRLHQLFTISDLSTVYTFTEVGDAKLLRDALKGKDISWVGWKYDWDPHAEIKLLFMALNQKLVWCSKYIGVSKLMCPLCNTWYRLYNKTYEEEFCYLGSHGQVFKYWKLPALLCFESLLTDFQEWLGSMKLLCSRSSVVDQGQKFWVFKLKRKGPSKQVRDRSPEPRKQV